METQNIVSKIALGTLPSQNSYSLRQNLEVLSRYDLKQKIGRGGMGIVYRGKMKMACAWIQLTSHKPPTRKAAPLWLSS